MNRYIGLRGCCMKTILTSFDINNYYFTFLAGPKINVHLKICVCNKRVLYLNCVYYPLSVFVCLKL